MSDAPSFSVLLHPHTHWTGVEAISDMYGGFVTFRPEVSDDAGKTWRNLPGAASITAPPGASALWLDSDFPARGTRQYRVVTAAAASHALAVTRPLPPLATTPENARAAV